MMDSNDSIALKDMITAASPVIKSLVDTFVTPKLEAFRKKKNIEKQALAFLSDNNFKEYFHRTFKKLAIVNTLVFNNSQRFLSDIFVPLVLTSTGTKKIRAKIDGYPEQISDEFGNILITDTAGMGKSTLMKTVFLDLLNRKVGIPIFIELRRLSENKKLLDEIKEQFDSINSTFDNQMLLDLLMEGGFIIILDGYDEIPLNDRTKVTADIQEFIDKASNNRFFITSRPEKALASFGNFQEFKIDPLTKKQAFELLRKYDNQGSISSLLIKKLQEKDMANIEEFLTNPLLVSLLFTAFEHKQAIPFKKYLFYRQVYDANFESHDLTKGESYIHDKYSKLEIDDFHRVLRHIGFSCLKLQRIEFSKDELLKLITESKNFCAGLNFSESDLLQDILKTVPLFSQDGNYYRWAHKSLQEYFAAQFIYLDSKEKQNSILIKFYKHESLEKFINVLDLYYDMDYKTFRNIIEIDLLKKYRTFSQEKYNMLYPDVDPKYIIRRKELAFMYDSFLFYSSSLDMGNEVSHDLLDQIIYECQQQYNVKENNFTGILLGSEVADNLFALHYETSQFPILRLLSAKKNPIVKFILRSGDEQILVDYPRVNELQLHEVIDSPEDILNSKDNFHSVNEFLEVTRVENLTIDHKTALEKLNEIEESIKSESQDDFLLSGL